MRRVQKCVTVCGSKKKHNWFLTLRNLQTSPEKQKIWFFSHPNICPFNKKKVNLFRRFSFLLCFKIALSGSKITMFEKYLRFIFMCSCVVLWSKFCDKKTMSESKKKNHRKYYLTHKSCEFSVWRFFLIRKSNIFSYELIRESSSWKHFTFKICLRFKYIFFWGINTIKKNLENVNCDEINVKIFLDCLMRSVELREKFYYFRMLMKWIKISFSHQTSCHPFYETKKCVTIKLKLTNVQVMWIISLNYASKSCYAGLENGEKGLHKSVLREKSKGNKNTNL